MRDSYLLFVRKYVGLPFKIAIFLMELSDARRCICAGGRLIDLSVPVVMGILNYTPDSFYDGGLYNDPSALTKRVAAMISDGAGIIDVGGVSTRPGAPGVTAEEEIRRLSEAIGAIRKEFPEILVSVDTWRSETAEIMVRDFGADMINDVSAGIMDRKMPETAGKLKVPYVAMHMQGTPQTMQKNPVYDDVVNDLIKFFAERIRILRQEGVGDIIIDPGFGFGKTLDHNYEIAARLSDFLILDLPVMVGFSRKSMVSRVVGGGPGEALAGTVALNTFAVMNGASILRVHDVKEAKNAIAVAMCLKNSYNRSDL